ncbi:hypothetical protein F3Y22_tig00110482pilonHSYRG00744 [Hibiscus syriacus]|uniref:Uncharacterized protein n=1 Tax=Hibiscus syriacus TaxID=106335 RepID=A0A6A3AG18_HIBSY|nr:hypothetical protein F3Y22_tig00110482pilonHSYRG00744 [Hibiscus syriacus]
MFQKGMAAKSFISTHFDGFLGVGTFFVIHQVLVRRELDLSAKELQEQVRSGDASATELFELGAVMLRRKFYPSANKFLLQAIEKWDGDDQDLAQFTMLLVSAKFGTGSLRKESINSKLLWSFNQDMSRLGTILAMRTRRKRTIRLH